MSNGSRTQATRSAKSASARRNIAACGKRSAPTSAARPQHIDHPGYGRSDTFYWATGKASAIRTCNSWAADRLRLAGVKTSLWPPFVQGLTWRYRKSGPATKSLANRPRER